MLRGYDREAWFECGRFLSVSLVSSFVFCPFKVFLVAGLGLREDVYGPPMVGKVVHEFYGELCRVLATGGDVGPVLKRFGDLDEGFKSRVYEFRVSTPFAGYPVKVEHALSSPRLSLKGVVDLLEGWVPVEVKFRDRVLESDRIQLALYALLIEDIYGVDVDYGFIDLLAVPRRVRVEISDGLRRRALKFRDKVFEVRVEGSLEKRRSSCRYCGFRDFCKLYFS